MREKLGETISLNQKEVKQYKWQDVILVRF